MGRRMVILAVLMTGLYGLDRELAALESREVANEARRLEDKGAAALERGDTKGAVDFLLHAHSMERENRAYLLRLAEAQRKAGKLEDASASLEQLLAEDSNNAAANLEMARTEVAGRQYTNAASYYHRALFGDGSVDVVKVRLELARLLAGQGSKQELLAELLLMEEPAAKNRALAAEVAALFLQAGAAPRAGEMYRALLRMDPQDRAAQAGLAQVALEGGDYRAAANGFARAGDSTRQQLARDLLDLDPTPRRLSAAEKYRRSFEILNRTAAACGQTLDLKPGQPTNENAEALLDQASGIWTGGNCKVADNDPLPFLQKKIAE